LKIAELFEPHQFRLAEGSIGDPGPGEVQARVETVGICGSDLHYFAEGGIGDTLCRYPMVLGHEPTGVILKTGPGVTGWAAGDRVALEPAIYCYHCEYCVTGRHNVCANIRFLSMPGDPGFFREFVNLPARNLLPLPANLSFQEGSLFEPLAIILHSMKFTLIHVGDTAAVFGAGPIGLLTVALLKMSGAGRVWVSEPVEHRRELARIMGADAVIDPKAADPVREILTDTGQRGVDVAIDCAARDGAYNQAVNVARNAGRVVLTGIPSETHISLEFHPIRRKELALFVVRRSNHDSEAALHLLRDHSRRFAPMLTHTRPLEDVQDVFNMLEHYADGVGKATLQIPRS
jgi:L-iditol 2-dehydrogenase